MQETIETARRGDWFTTFSGRKFWPLDPYPEDVVIEDIAHALANTCRFGGHCREFYSVAQHSVLVSRYAPPGMELLGLLHDATEAYVGDMVRPLKSSLPEYREIEDALWPAIARRFYLPTCNPRQFTALKEVDDRMLLTERRDVLIKTDHVWSLQGEPFPDVVQPLSASEAEFLFLQRFNFLQEMQA